MDQYWNIENQTIDVLEIPEHITCIDVYDSTIKRVVIPEHIQRADFTNCKVLEWGEILMEELNLLKGEYAPLPNVPNIKYLDVQETNLTYYPVLHPMCHIDETMTSIEDEHLPTPICGDISYITSHSRIGSIGNCSLCEKSNSMPVVLYNIGEATVLELYIDRYASESTPYTAYYLCGQDGWLCQD